MVRARAVFVAEFVYHALELLVLIVQGLAVLLEQFCENLVLPRKLLVFLGERSDQLRVPRPAAVSPHPAEDPGDWASARSGPSPDSQVTPAIHLAWCDATMGTMEVLPAWGQ